MRRPGRPRLRSRRTIAALVVAVLVVVVAVVAGVAASNSPSYRTVSAFVTGTPEGNAPVRLDTTLYLPDSTPAPAILLSQGFGGSKTSLAAEGELLARHGFVALAYTARGFGDSGGKIHFDAPRYEVHDAELLVDHLAAMPQVQKVNGSPQIGVAGASYGGALALLLAGSDPMIKAVAADITWNDLSSALFPNAAGSRPGVFKKLWAGELFGTAFGAGLGTSTDLSSLLAEGDPPTESTGSASCGRFAAGVCAAYQDAARTGLPDAAMTRLMRAASPASVLSHITAPTLLTQGEQDSLFPLTQADANARGIAATGTPVRLIWRRGGHDDGSVGGGVVTSQQLAWFDAAFHGHIGSTQPLQVADRSGGLTPARDHRTRAVGISGPQQTIGAPAGGTPAAITAVPGLGAVFSTLGSATSALSIIPSQTAGFVSSPLPSSALVAGASTVRLTVTPQQDGTATLFLSMRDLDSDGSTVLPANLVAPLRLTGLRSGVARTVTARLPAVVHTVPSGHRLVVSVATTDFAYQLPQDARTYTISLPSGTDDVDVPTVSLSSQGTSEPIGWLVVGAVAVVLAFLTVAVVTRRRRRVLREAPELATVPVAITNLVKEYAGGYRAVDDISFRVERGQVVGLLGPNGAGKTTALRVLVGLITPTAGTIHVFGEPISPGAPVLARVGAFIEGPGFLPHLSGRDNLRLYWQATGRRDADAAFDTALDIAGLGSSLDRRVRTYSHGMKQRLGIAQAMLGLPELLVLDEPTNGLDPPQIAEMREVMRRYAETGRTVIVSSHLLSEVEQTCSDVVVMHKGRVVAAGTVAEIAGAGGTQLVVDDPEQAQRILAAAGVGASLVPARRALEDVFLGLIGGDE